MHCDDYDDEDNVEYTADVDVDGEIEEYLKKEGKGEGGSEDGCGAQVRLGVKSRWLRGPYEDTHVLHSRLSSDIDNQIV